MRVHVIATIIICVCVMGNAQTPIFPELFGDELVDALAEAYSPNEVLSLSQAKDSIYGSVDKSDKDSVRCFYTDRALFVPPGQDPSQAVFLNGQGINLEHLWPQSKGAGDGTVGQSDMHHLVPSRVEVNADRANDMFEEIPDDQTDKWYYLNQTFTSIPQEMIEAYSEDANGRFEPREDRKGDVARAMMYFYTIHNSDADQTFFEAQLSTLCTWHLADPVSEVELDRAQRIALIQGNKNPFVLDCTLPSRAFCGSDYACTSAANDNKGRKSEVSVSSYGCKVYIQFGGYPFKSARLHIYSIEGVERFSVSIDQHTLAEGFTADLCGLPSGLYLVGTQVVTGTGARRLSTQKVFISGVR